MVLALYVFSVVDVCRIVVPFLKAYVHVPLGDAAAVSVTVDPSHTALAVLDVRLTVLGAVQRGTVLQVTIACPAMEFTFCPIKFA